MKKIVFSLVLILSAISGFSQVDEPTITIGVNSGIDHNFNAYQLKGFGKNEALDVTYTYFGINNQYNIGIDFGFIINKNMRARAELRYVNASYGMTFDTSINPTYISSNWNINNFDINFHFDYLLLTYKKLELFASPGIKYEYVTGEYVQSHVIKLNELPVGAPVLGPAVISGRLNNMRVAYPSNILGGTLEMLFKYNISKHVGITLIPEYTMFVRPYVRPNHNIYSRFSTNAGLEFKF